MARLANLVLGAAAFAASWLWYANAPDQGLAHGLAAFGCIAFGGFLYISIVRLVGEPVRLHRARHPRRLVAAAQRDAGEGLRSDERIEDAVKCMLLGNDWLALPAVRTGLPRTTSAALGLHAAWLQRVDRARSTEVVLGRTSGRLVLYKADFPRLTYIAAVPFAQIRGVESGAARLLRSDRGLVGFNFNDGSSAAALYDLKLDDVMSRFCAPIHDALEP